MTLGFFVRWAFRIALPQQWSLPLHLNLHRNYRQVTMYRNLPKSSSRNPVQGALSLQSGEHSFHCCSLCVNCLPFGCLEQRFHLCQGLFVIGRSVNHRYRCILPPNKFPQRIVRIPLISNDKPGMEPAVGKWCLTQNPRSCSAVVSIARSDDSGDRKLAFAVHEEMKFIAKYKLVFPVGILLHRPSGVSIGRS